MAKRAALYARTVAYATPTIDDQLNVLQQSAAHQGWHIVAIHTDITQISPSGRARHPGLDNLLRLVRSSELDLVAIHSLCRLGRSLVDLVHILADLHAHGVELYVHQHAIDTATPPGQTLFETAGLFTRTNGRWHANASSAGSAAPC